MQHHLLSGDSVRRGNTAFTRGILRDSKVEVVSSGSDFYNANKFPHIAFLYAFCDFLKRHRSRPASISNQRVRSIWRDARQELKGQNKIVIAATPEKVDKEYLSILDGGILHEAFHSIYTHNGPQLDLNRMEAILQRAYDPEVPYENKPKLLKTFLNVYEDSFIERYGALDFAGAPYSINRVHELIWDRERVGRNMEPGTKVWSDEKKCYLRAFDMIDHVVCYLRDRVQPYLVGAPLSEYHPDARYVVETHMGHLIDRGQNSQSTYDCFELALETLNVLAKLADQQPQGNGQGDPDQQQEPQEQQDSNQDPSDSNCEGESQSKTECDEPGDSEDQSNSEAGDQESTEGDSPSEGGDESQDDSDSNSSGGQEQGDSDDGAKESGDDEESGDDSSAGDDDTSKGDSGTEDDGGEGKDEEDSEGKDGDEGEEEDGEAESSGDSEDEEGDEDEGDTDASSGDEDDGEGSEDDAGGSDQKEGKGDGAGQQDASEDDGDDEDPIPEPTDFDSLADELAGAEKAEGISDIEGIINDKWKDLEEGSSDLPQTDRPLTREYDVINYIEKGDLSKFRQMSAKVRKDSLYIRSKLMVFLRGEKKIRRRHRLEKGRQLSSRSVHEVVYKKKPRPFQSRIKKETENAVVSIVIDESGSMAGEKDRARYMLATFAVSLQQLRIPFEVIGFRSGRYITSQYEADYGKTSTPEWRNFTRVYSTTFDVFRTFDEPLTDQSLSKLMQTTATGGTPLLAGYDFAARRIVERPEPRRIIIVITDGDPTTGGGTRYNSSDHTLICNKESKLLETLGIETLFVGYGLGARNIRHFDNHIYVPDLPSFSKCMNEYLMSSLRKNTLTRA